MKISATHSGLRSAAALDSAAEYVILSSWPQPLADLAAQVVAITNAFRASKGLHSLAVNTTLTGIADWKSSDMGEFQYMDHDQPAGSVPGTTSPTTISDRFAALGYPNNAAWGENIAYGFTDAQSVFNAWTSAGPGEGHYDNIVNPTWTAIGVGAAEGNGLIFWTQDFGNPPIGSPPKVASVSPTTAAIGDTVTFTGTGLSNLVAIAFPPASGSAMINATFTSVSDTTVKVVVPQGSASGQPIVDTLGGEVFAPAITIGSAPPPPPPPPPTKPQVGQTWALNKNKKTHVKVLEIIGNKVKIENLKTLKSRTILITSLENGYTLIS